MCFPLLPADLLNSSQNSSNSLRCQNRRCGKKFEGNQQNKNWYYLWQYSQLPINLFLRKLGVTNWLSFFVTFWGAIQIAICYHLGAPWTLQSTFGCIRSSRMMLSLALSLPTLNLKHNQAEFFPAIVYIITTWYIRSYPRHHAIFYLLSQHYIFSSCLSDSLQLDCFPHPQHSYRRL